MDSAGLGWTLIAIVAPLLLLVFIAWALLRSRGSRTDVDCDEATRRVYEEEDREHRHESDNVP